MNRSILIVICDFLLVSLLAFSTVDINKATDHATTRTVTLEMATNQPDAGHDLAAVMRLALDEERKNRDKLLGELTRTRETATEREKQALNLQRELSAREEQTQRLQQQQSALQQQFASAQTSIQDLSKQLQSSSTEATLSKEKLAAIEAEARKQAELAASFQKQLAQLQRTNELVMNEKQQLAGQLQVAEVERRAATEQAGRLEQQVKVEREEKAKLAEGVKVLATKSSELAQEVRENRALAPNTIFDEFVSNRVEARFTAVRSGILGLDTNKRRDTQTVLVSNGTNTFALCHIQDTPLTLWNQSQDWDELSGTLARGSSGAAISALSFAAHDPRVVLIPVSAADAKRLGAKVYTISSNPFRFQDAVLVGAREGYYGECKFQIDLSTPDYLKLDNSFVKGLFGKFNPSRGDIVFSRNGDLLGIMANSTYCFMLRNFDTSATFHFGADVRAQHTSRVMSELYSMVTGFPYKLQ